MDLKDSRFEIEETEYEQIYVFGGGCLRQDNVVNSESYGKLKKTLTIIKGGQFIITCFIVQIICYNITNEKIIELVCFDPAKKNELWRLITYAFFHSNIYHLVPNLLFLLLVGIILENDQGTCRTFVVFITGIVSGALGCYIFAQEQKVIGISAACSSLLLAHVTHISVNWRFVRCKDYRIAVVGCLLFSDVISYFLSKHFFQSTTISWSSHFAASVNGLLISGVLFRFVQPCHIYRYLSLTIYVALITFSIIVYVPCLTETACQYSNIVYINSSIWTNFRNSSKYINCFNFKLHNHYTG